MAKNLDFRVGMKLIEGISVQLMGEEMLNNFVVLRFRRA